MSTDVHPVQSASARLGVVMRGPFPLNASPPPSMSSRCVQHFQPPIVHDRNLFPISAAVQSIEARCLEATDRVFVPLDRTQALLIAHTAGLPGLNGPHQIVKRAEFLQLS